MRKQPLLSVPVRPKVTDHEGGFSIDSAFVTFFRSDGDADTLLGPPFP